MNENLPPRFLRSLQNYLRYWLAETAVLDDAQIAKCDPDFVNLLALLQTAVFVPHVTSDTTKLVLQCFFWIETRGYVQPWREIVETLIPNVANRGDKLRLLKQLGQLYRLEQNHEAAFHTLAEARFLAEQQQEQQAVAEILINAAHLYWQQKQMHAASQAANKALALLVGQQNRMVGIAHQIAAEAAREMGAFETAVNHLQKAQALFQHDSRLTDLTRILNSLAVTYQQMGANEQALQLFPKIIQLLTDTVHERDWVEAQLNWGHALYNAQKYAVAQQQFAKIISHIQHRDGYLPLRAMAHNNLACTLREVGQFSQAKAHFEESARLYERLQNGRLLANTLGGLATLYERQGTVQKSIDLLTQAIELLATILNDPWAENLQQRYQARRQKMESEL